MNALNHKIFGQERSSYPRNGADVPNSFSKSGGIFKVFVRVVEFSTHIVELTLILKAVGWVAS